MKRLLAKPLPCAVAALALAIAASTWQVNAEQPAAATRPASSRPAPRTADGRPDLSGFWRGPLLRNMDKNVPGGFKAIFTPAGAAAYERNRTKTINPEGLCLFAGIPRASIRDRKSTRLNSSHSELSRMPSSA